MRTGGICDSFSFSYGRDLFFSFSIIIVVILLFSFPALLVFFFVVFAYITGDSLFFLLSFVHAFVRAFRFCRLRRLMAWSSCSRFFLPHSLCFVFLVRMLSVSSSFVFPFVRFCVYLYRVVWFRGSCYRVSCFLCPFRAVVCSARRRLVFFFLADARGCQTRRCCRRTFRLNFVTSYLLCGFYFFIPTCPDVRNLEFAEALLSSAPPICPLWLECLLNYLDEFGNFPVLAGVRFYANKPRYPHPSVSSATPFAQR